MTKKILFTLLFFIFIQFSAKLTLASSCAEHPPLFVHYYRANAVFVGKVTNIKPYKFEKAEQFFHEKYRTVDFEIQKTYKGIKDSSVKKISLLNISFSYDEEEAELKKGQIWMVFTYEHKGKTFFGGMCNPSGEIESQSDIDDYEKGIFSFKEKQAIVGRVENSFSRTALKDVEVILEGNGKKAVTRTDDQGVYYFPVPTGNYEITLTVSPSGFYNGYSDVKTIDIKDPGAKNNRPIKVRLIYKASLKENELLYEDIPIYIFPIDN